MSEKRLLGKVAIITGSTGGIGEAIALLFAEQGASVVVSGRSKTNGNRVVQTIANAGDTAEFIRCDVGDDAQAEALIRGAVERFGALHVLVNNAADIQGAHGPGGDVVTTSRTLWDRQIRVNLSAVYYLSHLAIPLIRKAGGGTIVNISSVGSVVAWPKSAAYLTSKGGMNQLTRSMAVDYGPDNIRVNALCPGWILTPPEQRRIEKDPTVVDKVKERMGLQRLGAPREMAYAALFLACDESSYVTGTTLMADGGWTIQ